MSNPYALTSTYIHEQLRLEILGSRFRTSAKKVQRRVQEPAVHRVTSWNEDVQAGVTMPGQYRIVDDLRVIYPVLQPGFRVLSSSDHNAVFPVP